MAGSPKDVRSLLTDEELTALLGPTPGSVPAWPATVLLVLPQPAEARLAASRLAGLGLAAVSVANCYAALDVLRSGGFAALVAAAEMLPADRVGYPARLRVLDPNVRLYVVAESSGEAVPSEAVLLPRPLTAEKLDLAFSPLRITKPDEAPRAQPLPVHPPGPASSEAAAEARASGSPAPAPDPLLAVRALLEARVEGRGLARGLERWAAVDPGIGGFVQIEERGREVRLRATTDDESERTRRLALLLLEQLGDRPLDLLQPIAEGPFWLFPLEDDPGTLAALWREAPEEDGNALERLRPLLALLQGVGGNPASTDPARARARFSALLEARLKAAGRRDRRLGVMLFEGPPGASAAEVAQVLREILRGGDWVEVVGPSVYVILEEPEQGVFAALGHRLKELPRLRGLRVVALGWKPGEGDSSQLLERAEAVLRAGGGAEVPAPTVSGAGSREKSDRTG